MNNIIILENKYKTMMEPYLFLAFPIIIIYNMMKYIQEWWFV